MTPNSLSSPSCLNHLRASSRPAEELPAGGAPGEGPLVFCFQDKITFHSPIIGFRGADHDP